MVLLHSTDPLCLCIVQQQGPKAVCPSDHISYNYPLLSVIRRSVMPFGSSESLLTRCDLIANPTPASRRSSFLRLLQKKV